MGGDKKYLYSSKNWHEIEILSHVFSFPINHRYNYYSNQELRNSISIKDKRFDSPKPIIRVTDIDLALIKASKRSVNFNFDDKKEGLPF